MINNLFIPLLRSRTTLFNSLTFRPKCMPGSRDTGVNIVNLKEVPVMYGYIHWRMTTVISDMFGSEGVKTYRMFFWIYLQKISWLWLYSLEWHKVLLFSDADVHDVVSAERDIGSGGAAMSRDSLQPVSLDAAWKAKGIALIHRKSAHNCLWILFSSLSWKMFKSLNHA